MDSGKRGDVQNRLCQAASNCRSALEHLAQAYEAQNDLTKAEAAWTEALALSEQQLTECQDRAKAALVSAGYLSNLGRLAQRRKRTDEARRCLEKALGHLEPILAAKPGPNDERIMLGQRYWYLTSLCLEIGETAQADATCRKAMAIFDALALAHAKDPYYRQELGFSHRLLGDVHRQAGRTKDAEQSYRTALKIYVKLTEEKPNSFFFAQEVGFTHWKLGWLYEARNELDKAEAAFRQGLAVYQRAAKRFPDQAELRARAIAAERLLSAVLKKQGKVENK
jgi:tetratricopeptide (TPR) repeat protein